MRAGRLARQLRDGRDRFTFVLSGTDATVMVLCAVWLWSPDGHAAESPARNWAGLLRPCRFLRIRRWVGWLAPYRRWPEPPCQWPASSRWKTTVEVLPLVLVITTSP